MEAQVRVAREGSCGTHHVAMGLGAWTVTCSEKVRFVHPTTRRLMRRATIRHVQLLFGMFAFITSQLFLERAYWLASTYFTHRIYLRHSTHPDVTQFKLSVPFPGNISAQSLSAGCASILAPSVVGVC